MSILWPSNVKTWWLIKAWGNSDTQYLMINALLVTSKSYLRLEQWDDQQITYS